MSNKVYRNIDFFNIHDSADPDRNLADTLLNVFRHVQTLVVENNPARYQQTTDAFITMDKIQFKPNFILGRGVKINTNELPELLNMDDANYRDVEADEREGLIQTAHFIIDLRGRFPILAMQSVRSGVHPGAFMSMIALFSRRINEEFIPNLPLIVRDNYGRLSTRVQRIKSFEVAIHRDNIPYVNEFDPDLYSTLEASQNYAEGDFVRQEMKFDLNGGNVPTLMMQKFQRLVAILAQDPAKAELFKTLDIYGEDGDNNLRRTLFDLINNRVRGRVHVEKRERSTSLDSDMMFSEMEKELRKEFP